jgi:hypothetical protein
MISERVSCHSFVSVELILFSFLEIILGEYNITLVKVILKMATIG